VLAVKKRGETICLMGEEVNIQVAVHIEGKYYGGAEKGGI